MKPSRENPTKTLIYRGDLIVNDMQMEDIFACLFTETIRKLWDSRLDSIKMRRTKDITYFILTSKSAWGIAPRYFSIHLWPVHWNEKLSSFMLFIYYF
jgi:hypothetical protein